MHLSIYILSKPHCNNDDDYCKACGLTSQASYSPTLCYTELHVHMCITLLYQIMCRQTDKQKLMLTQHGPNAPNGGP